MQRKLWEVSFLEEEKEETFPLPPPKKNQSSLKIRGNVKVGFGRDSRQQV